MVGVYEGAVMLSTLDTVSIGRSITRGAVTLFPLYVHGVPAPRYLTGHEATGADRLTVEEAPSAMVPTLLATVAGEVPVLLVEGEAFLGGLQDRVLNTTVLLGSGRTEVPVSCVEAGRWRDGSRFERAGWHAPRRVRSTLSASVTASAVHGGDRFSDQGAVWAAVDETLTAREARSDTSALRDAMAAHRDTASGLEEAVAELVELGPLPGQSGVATAVGSRLVWAEVFDKPATLAAYWAELLGGLASEVEVTSGRPPRLDSALGFVRRLRHAQRVVVDGVGLGRETRFHRAGQAGSVLEWEGALVHLSTYALAA
jgi:hypothetical protein